MNISLDCIPCIVNSFLRLLQSGILPDAEKEPAMRRLLDFLARADYRQSPPALGREMHRMIREVLKNPDPYKEIKEKFNTMMLGFYDDFKKMVQQADDPFDMAMRLAIAGNVIDFGPQHQLDVMDTIQRVVHADLAIDDSPQLRRDVQAASTVLYVGDNCGEIVTDKLFIEIMNHPNIYFAVRGSPAINDVTVDDATTIGMDQWANIVTTGDDAPGAVWETASDDFRKLFLTADVVIAKGQGNLEGLIDVKHTIYFLLVTKCDLIANRVGAKTGDFIVKKTDNIA
jgi:damage-control phosphatase, subfamily I